MAYYFRPSFECCSVTLLILTIDIAHKLNYVFRYKNALKLSARKINVSSPTLDNDFVAYLCLEKKTKKKQEISR